MGIPLGARCVMGRINISDFSRQGHWVVGRDPGFVANGCGFQICGRSTPTPQHRAACLRTTRLRRSTRTVAGGAKDPSAAHPKGWAWRFCLQGDGCLNRNPRSPCKAFRQAETNIATIETVVLCFTFQRPRSQMHVRSILKYSFVRTA